MAKEEVPKEKVETKTSTRNWDDKVEIQ